MIPCSEAEKEAQPVSIPMSTVIDAPVECLWEKIDAWSTDCTWVQGSQVGCGPLFAARFHIAILLHMCSLDSWRHDGLQPCSYSTQLCLHLRMRGISIKTNYSLYHVQGITELTPFLRVLHFKTTDVPVIRQTKPLSDPEQPANGHRLIYYMLGGALLTSS
jgi:hypothetical protein